MPVLVAFGAGNVGRGFIGDIFASSGWRVVFVDINPAVVEALARDGFYLHETLSNSGTMQRRINNVTAVYADDTPRIEHWISRADLITTSVGVRALPAIAPALATGLRARWRAGGGPVDVLLCENLHRAPEEMRRLLRNHLPDFSEDFLSAHLGLAETSIGRMIPSLPVEQRLPPTLIRVEPYRILPYDAQACRGPEPRAEGLLPVRDQPFVYYADRKLFIHNMGHCVCAYLGALLGCEYIWQAIGRAQVRYIVRATMAQSALALSAHYGVDARDLERHIDDLIARFANRALADTTERVGQDPARKMGAEDRLLGAYAFARAAEAPLEFLSLAVALGVNRLSDEADWGCNRAWAHVVSALFAGNEADPACQFLRAQVDALQGGWDWDKQMRLLDESPLRACVV